MPCISDVVKLPVSVPSKSAINNLIVRVNYRCLRRAGSAGGPEAARCEPRVADYEGVPRNGSERGQNFALFVCCGVPRLVRKAGNPRRLRRYHFFSSAS